MRHLFGLLSLSFILNLLIMPLALSQAVKSPPLAETIRTQVRDCSPSSRLNVPIITWGADMVTILANGNAQKTTGDALFSDLGLSVNLERQDDFTRQIENYLRCDSPFLRATTGMANLASDVTEADPRTELVAIYQHSWSAGGDALVVKENIQRPADLRGKEIAVQRYGPHVDYALKVLSDAGLSQDDVEIVWTKDLVGFKKSAPATLFSDRDDIAGAFVIIPDALALTSDGTVGNGAEGSVRGARILLSTKSANRIIADQYFVRRDFFDAQRETVEAFARGLLIAEEMARDILAPANKQTAEYKQLIAASAEMLLDDPGAMADTEGLWADAETVGFSGNVKFYTSDGFLRNYARLNNEVQASTRSWGLLSGAHVLGLANWDWQTFASDLTNAEATDTPRFDTEAATEVITKFQASGQIDNETLFEFEINFAPNQTNFAGTLYEDAFNQVLELASTYAGAVISVEGHSDPLKYLKFVKANEPAWKLRRLKTSTRNLSLGRAQSVRDALIEQATSRAVLLDPSQFVTVGLGIETPKTGQCGELPCAPQTEGEWRSNMRVVFRVVSMEAEASVFTPL